MAEMPDVIGGEVISSDWGNDIRDRTIQRYADVAERSSEHPTPVDGDLSFLNSTGLVYVYTSGLWRFLGGSETVEGAGTPSNTTTTASFTALKQFGLVIPGHWDEWDCVAQAFWAHHSPPATVTTVQYRLEVDGVEATTVTFDVTSENVSMARAFRRTGLTSTGSRTIALEGRHTGSSVVTCEDVFLTARATRTV